MSHQSRVTKYIYQYVGLEGAPSSIDGALY